MEKEGKNIYVELSYSSESTSIYYNTVYYKYSGE